MRGHSFLRIAILLLLAYPVYVNGQKISTQTRPSGTTATVYVHVIGELAPLQIAGARIELLDLHGNTLRVAETGSDPQTRRIGLVEVIDSTGIFRSVPLGTYDLKVVAVDFKPATRRIVIGQREHWFTVALSLAPSDRTAESARFRVRTSIGSPENPIWARLVGLYSQVIQDARVKEDGVAEFIVPSSRYVLFILRGKSVCLMQQFDVPFSPNEMPVAVSLSRECQ
jgi:hypothetical protein